MTEQRAERRLPGRRAAMMIAGCLLGGVLAGLGLGVAFPGLLEGDGAASPVATETAMNGGAMQRAGLEARVAEWRNEMAGLAGSETLDGEAAARLTPLEMALVQVETDRARLDAEGAETADKAAKYEGLQHREDLLRLSYDGELGRLTMGQRVAAHRGLLQREISGAQDYLGGLAPVAVAPKAASEANPPVARARALEAGAGGVAGGLLGVGVVLLLRRRREPVEVGAEPAGESDFAVAELGSISPADLLDESQDSPMSRASLELGYAMLAEDWGKGVRSYAVTGEESAMVTAQVGLALSRIGLKVVVMDFGSRGLRELFGVEHELGWGDWTASETEAETAPLTGLVHASRFERLGVILRGSGEGGMGGDRMRLLLRRLMTEWDLVLMDAPELVEGFEGGMVLAVRDGEGRYERGAVELRRLAEQGLRVTGVVLLRESEASTQPKSKAISGVDS